MILSEGKLYRINLILFITIIELSVFVQAFQAQQNETFLAEFTMSSKDAVKSSKITYVIKPNDRFDGYFIIPKHFKSIFGNAGRGGYDYLNYEENGSNPEFLIPRWIENDSPLLGDLEGFIKGSDSKTVLSFQIKPVYSSNENSNKKVFLAKFAAISQNEKQENASIEIDSKTKVFYKALKQDENGKVNLDFLQTALPEYKFGLVIKTLQKEQQALNVNQALFSVIKNSIRESNINKIDFAFSAEIGIYPPKELRSFQNVNNLRNYELFNLTEVYNIVSNNSDSLKVNTPIYLAEFKFPFSLYNESKMKRYNSYETSTNIFASNYKVILIPINYTKNKLTADVIVDYAKLNLNDEIPRWSSFKKRLVFDHNRCLIEMPQENWSAVFTKEKDKYEIYGYSDYEKYVSELLFISLRQSQKEN
ncbi:MAG: hypothetical protein FD143_113 [Ignavibacteria bacterium]|nr:MAG: hypothetical protein FD143_113 [Ignavibacteria bacterium]KAF0162473.1 MAG: hypothetical protein FD188_76 [Ignavibacteria bacterium]